MFRASFDPFCSGWETFRSFMDCAGWSSRRFYTRKERIEELEKIKKRMLQEIAGIDELIEDLKKQGAR